MSKICTDFLIASHRAYLHFTQTALITVSVPFSTQSRHINLAIIGMRTLFTWRHPQQQRQVGKYASDI